MTPDRSIIAAVAARFISRTGGEAAFFVGIWGKAAFVFDASPTGLAILMAGLGITSLAGSAVGGMLIDRHGPKRVLIVGELLFAPATVLAAFSTNMNQLTIAVAAIGLFSAPIYTAIASLGPYLTDDEERLARVNAWLETAGMATLISGAAIGAIIADRISIDAIFWFDGATSVIAAAIVWPIRLRSLKRETEPSGSSIEEIRQGFRYSYGRPRLRFYMLVGSAVWLWFGLFGVLEPLFYRDVLERGPETIGWVNTVLGVGLVAGTLAGGRLPTRLRTAQTVLLLMAANGATGMLYVGTTDLRVVAVGAILWGVVLGLFIPLVRTLIQINAEDHMIGRVMGTNHVHGELAQLLPLMAAPTVAAVFGVQRSLQLSAIVLIVVSLALLPSGRRLDRTRVIEVPPPGTDAIASEPRSPTV